MHWSINSQTITNSSITQKSKSTVSSDSQGKFSAVNPYKIQNTDVAWFTNNSFYDPGADSCICIQGGKDAEFEIEAKLQQMLLFANLVIHEQNIWAKILLYKLQGLKIYNGTSEAVPFQKKDQDWAEQILHVIACLAFGTWW